MLVKKNYHRYSFFKAIKNYINYILVMPVFMYTFINIFIMPTSHGMVDLHKQLLISKILLNNLGGQLILEYIG